MQDDVLNRRLFNRGSSAARDRVRQMGGVQEPRGILASYQELIEAARPKRGQGLMPMIMQDARPIQPVMAMPRPQPQTQPVRMQEGGDLALEALRQGAAEPTLGQQFAAVQGQAMAQPVDITATPTARAPVETPDIMSMVRARLSGNDEALASLDDLETTLNNPESTPEDVQQAVTGAAGVENTADGMRSVVSAITGREQPADATVDELNRAIMGVSLGGAIGGPRSVAERISNALLVGLQAQRETATTREAEESAIRRAAIGGRSSGRRSTYTPERLFQQAVQEIMKDPGEYDVYSVNPETNEEFVDPLKVRTIAEQIASVQATALSGEPAQAVAEDVATTTYTNPETGQVITWNGTTWVDAQSGEPVQ